MTTLLIVNRLGTVHAVRDGHTCKAVLRARKQKEINALQALVYKLPHCDLCWPVVSEYQRHVGRRL